MLSAILAQDGRLSVKRILLSLLPGIQLVLPLRASALAEGPHIDEPREPAVIYINTTSPGPPVFGEGGNTVTGIDILVDERWVNRPSNLR